MQAPPLRLTNSGADGARLHGSVSPRGLTQRRSGLTETLHLPRVQPKVPQLYWEDFTPGRTFEHGPRRMPRDEMVAFAAEFDPQPMHLDDAAARESMLGGLAASGWYVCCILMRMCVDAFVGNSASMGAPGVDEVKWLKPVRPDDELTLHAKVLESRSSKSRPEMGFVRFEFGLTDVHGRPAMVLVTSLMVSRRNPGGAA